jgi:hypothetical protein
MATLAMSAADGATHRLYYASIPDPQHAEAFPCDSAGKVDLDRLGRRRLQQYLFVRAMVGRGFSPPVIQIACREAAATPQYLTVLLRVSHP